MRLMALVPMLGLAVLGGCAQAPNSTDTESRVRSLLAHVLPTPLLLVGEQHDAPEHQALQARLVAALVEQEQLAALVLDWS